MMEEEVTPIRELSPMQEVSVDLFALSGKHYLVMVDKYSGMPLHKLLRGEGTTDVTNAMEEFCTWFGLPEVVRADYGPCFQKSFDDWLLKKGTKHEQSSAYNPSSNGLAEQGMQRVKSVIRKAVMAWELVDLAVAEFRNAWIQAQFSPSEMFFKRKLCGELPHIRTHLDLVEGEQLREEVPGGRCYVESLPCVFFRWGICMVAG